MQTQCMLFANIPLYRRDGTVIAYTKVDLEQAAYLSQWRWFRTNYGYACRRVGSSTGTCRRIFMHRLLLGLTYADGIATDHINRDRLDNRLSNIRRVTQAENTQNRPSVRGASSRYRGVYWASINQRWIAVGSLNGKRYALGSFLNEAEAGVTARTWRLQHMPFAVD